MAIAPQLKFRSGKPTNAQRAVGGMMLDVAFELQSWLFWADRVATGEAINTILIEVFKSFKGSSYIMSTVKYFEYALTGRAKGKMPPVSSIEQWTLDKGLAVPPEFKTRNAFAWAIAKGIEKSGTAPPHFNERDFKLITERAYKKFSDRIPNAMSKVFIDQLEGSFTSSNFKLK